MEALRGEGIAYLKMGKYEEAQQALEKARDLAADSEKAMRADISSGERPISIWISMTRRHPTLEKWLQIPKSIMTIWKSTVYTKSVT